MKILALDLGTKTGWALRADDETVTSGTWILATPKALKLQKEAGQDRCCDVRIENLFTHVHELMPADFVYFEDVQFLSTQLQAQLWASLRGAVMMAACSNAKVRAVPVGTLKKFATGHGNAKKDGMALALYKSAGGRYEGAPQNLVEKGTYVVERSTQRPIDDNEVDALHLLALAIKEQIK